MNRKPKGKRTQKRPFNREERSEKSESKFERKEKCNDPSWYIREGQLAKDVASFSFNTALGLAQDIGPDRNVGQNVNGRNVHLPGIMRIHTIPGVGYSSSSASPINLAAKNLYSWVRHANSGHTNYDSPDLMLYLVAMDSLYALIWHLQRAYGTARVYSQKNRYIGDALLESMGFYPNELRSNLSDFRAFINMLIVKASAFCTPTTMTLFKRHTWMYSGIYKDEDIEKCQMYLYVPTFLYSYEEVGGIGKCQPIPIVADALPGSNGEIVASQHNLSTWYSNANYMISNLVGSEDINVMSGDIRKAFGEGNLWNIGLIPEDFSVVPIYSDEILDQIHNTIFVGSMPRAVLDTTDPTEFTTYSLDNLVVRQDPSDPLQPIIWKPQFIQSLAACIEHFCDMAENEPTPERILVGTRNMVHSDVTHYSVGGMEMWLSEIDSIGSDLCFFADVYHYNNAGTLLHTRFFDINYNYIDVELYSKFHKAPLSYKFTFDGGTSSMNLEEIVGELGNFIVLDYTDIDKMHQSAILSMLGVPV